jgi:hypothetical protein
LRYISSVRFSSSVIGLLACAACAAVDDPAAESSTSAGHGGSNGGGPAASASTGTGGGIGLGSGGAGGAGGAVKACKVSEGGDSENAPVCTRKAPADSFSPVVQWTWTSPPADPGALYAGSFVTPLVGNFTDDNGDGEVDLCDVPDVLVNGIKTFGFDDIGLASTGWMFMLAGDTGQEEVQFDGLVDTFVYPAFGDLDGDGIPEVVAADDTQRVVVYSSTGAIVTTGDVAGYRTTFNSGQCSTVAIYDLEGDGSPEILLGWEVFDRDGKRLFGDATNAAELEGSYWCVTPTAADLDGDGTLEVLMGHETFRADGTLYWKLAGFTPGHPQVANLDADAEPEVLLTNQDGITVLEHDGTVKFGPVRPTSPDPDPFCWGKPAVIHDFDGDGVADLAAATCLDYSVYEIGATATPLWTQDVQDLSGLATATGFDFLGDGIAEAIYADETQIYVFDGATGQTSLTSPRQSGTLIEYPVVADIDNDDSAEIAFVSSYFMGSGGGMVAGPTLTVLGDAQDRWIPARRVWNQYSYHVTNVREDGTIPSAMKKSWQLLNTFRTNSQIDPNGVDCDPEPPK